MLTLPGRPRLTTADPRVDAARGCVAIERGPLVYCVESADHPGQRLDDLVLDVAASLSHRHGRRPARQIVALRAGLRRGVTSGRPGGRTRRAGRPPPADRRAGADRDPLLRLGKPRHRSDADLAADRLTLNGSPTPASYLVMVRRLTPTESPSGVSRRSEARSGEFGAPRLPHRRVSQGVPARSALIAAAEASTLSRSSAGRSPPVVDTLIAATTAPSTSRTGAAPGRTGRPPAPGRPRPSPGPRPRPAGPAARLGVHRPRGRRPQIGGQEVVVELIVPLVRQQHPAHRGGGRREARPHGDPDRHDPAGRHAGDVDDLRAVQHRRRRRLPNPARTTAPGAAGQLGQIETGQVRRTESQHVPGSARTACPSVRT